MKNRLIKYVRKANKEEYESAVSILINDVGFAAAKYDSILRSLRVKRAWATRKKRNDSN